MIPGAVQSFYRARRIYVAAICILPVLVLGGAWWLVSEVLLVPRPPGPSAPGEDAVGYIVHPKGFPRLSHDQAESWLAAQVERARTDAAYREQSMTAYRQLAPEEKQSLRTNLFRVMKPTLLRDVYRFDQLGGDERQHFLDERIVAYARMALPWQSVRPNMPGADDKMQGPEALAFLQNNTTEEEREAAGAYLRAYGERLQEIARDPALRKTFEKRILEAR